LATGELSGGAEDRHQFPHFGEYECRLHACAQESAEPLKEDSQLAKLCGRAIWTGQDPMTTLLGRRYASDFQ
jgi:hypothetical protein